MALYSGIFARFSLFPISPLFHCSLLFYPFLSNCIPYRPNEPPNGVSYPIHSSLEKLSQYFQDILSGELVS